MSILDPMPDAAVALKHAANPRAADPGQRALPGTHPDVSGLQGW